MKNEGFLFLSDTFYPGWKAYIDGKETKIYYANCAFRAVFLHKGKYDVIFQYRPGSFYKGAIISFIAFLLIVFFIFKFKSCKF